MPHNELVNCWLIIKNIRSFGRLAGWPAVVAHFVCLVARSSDFRPLALELVVIVVLPSWVVSTFPKISIKESVSIWPTLRQRFRLEYHDDDDDDDNNGGDDSDDDYVDQKGQQSTCSRARVYFVLTPLPSLPLSLPLCVSRRFAYLPLARSGDSIIDMVAVAYGSPLLLIWLHTPLMLMLTSLARFDVLFARCSLARLTIYRKSHTQTQAPSSPLVCFQFNLCKDRTQRVKYT